MWIWGEESLKNGYSSSKLILTGKIKLISPKNSRTRCWWVKVNIYFWIQLKILLFSMLWNLDKEHSASRKFNKSRACSRIRKTINFTKVNFRCKEESWKLWKIQFKIGICKADIQKEVVNKGLLSFYEFCCNSKARWTIELCCWSILFPNSHRKIVSIMEAKLFQH